MRTRLIVIIVLAFAVGALSAVAFVPSVREGLVSVQPSRVIGKAAVGGPFSMIDHTGKRVTEKDFAGRYTLVYFGFTFCPDVCPAGLQVITRALELLGDDAKRITPVFVSLDPERDTPQQMASYVKSFHPSLVGLTGTPADVDRMAKAYRVYYAKVKDPKLAAEYTIDHSSIVYLMGPDGNFVTHFTHSIAPDLLAKRLKDVL